MKIIGIKMTHDAAVCYIEDGKLIFNWEIEKLANNPRYSAMTSWDQVIEILEFNGVNIHECEVVIDGWKRGFIKAPWAIYVAPYSQFERIKNIEPIRSACDSVSGIIEGIGYTSYQHLTGHILGAYAMSPFSAIFEPADVLVWDGGCEPRVYRVNADLSVNYKGYLFSYYGILYSVMGYYFGPYKCAAEGNGFDQQGQYDWPGKLMSYIAYGKTNTKFERHVWRMFDDFQYLAERAGDLLDYRQTAIEEHAFCREVKWLAEIWEIDDATALNAIHNVIEKRIVEGLREKCEKGSNIIFTGGSALNIKWNTAIRESGHFHNVFVPPCPNDCGSAIGAAATHMAVRHKVGSLYWDVFCGPPVMISEPLPGWKCDGLVSAENLAQLMVSGAWPLVVLRGKAEIGPRALGHRSIFAPVNAPGAQAELNRVKKREEFRPVSPIVLEEYAEDWFNPGTFDPYMLFDHHARDNAKAEAKEIVHIDGTSRVQTVWDDIFMQDFLDHLSFRGSPPMVCNTSANLNGSGFFPDLRSAQVWADEVGVLAIYCEGELWRKE